MADTITLSVSNDRLTVNPGEQAQTVITIQNNSVAVGVFSVEVEGLDPLWANLSSTSVSLFPGDRSTTTLNVNPPRISASRAGSYEFRVRVVSQKEDGGEESLPLTLELLPFRSFLIDLSPQRLTGSKGSQTLSITNTGNSDLIFDLSGRDTEELTRFTFDPPNPTVGPGELGTVATTVQGKRPLRGVAKLYQYSVTAAPQGDVAQPASVPGFIEVPARIPSWVFRVAAILIVAIVITVVVLRFFVFRPLAPVDSFELSPSRVSLTQGETTRIVAVLLDSDGNALTGREITWVSNNQAVALVSDADGTIRGVGQGTAVITASLEGEDVDAQTAAVSVLPVAVSTDCIRYDPANLRFGVSDGSMLVLTDGSVEILTFEDSDDQQNSVRLASQHSARCFIGRAALEANEGDSQVVEFWTGSADSADVDEIAPADCVAYSADAVQIRAQDGGIWSVTDGGSLQLRLGSQEDAQAAQILVTRNTEQCFISRGTGAGGPSRYLTQYWQ